MFLETSDDKLYKQVLKEFGKTKEDIEDYVRLLREWSQSQPHFPEKPSDKLLQYFLLCHKFRTEDTKQGIDMYYTLRTMIPEFFSQSPFSEVIKKQTRILQTIPLPKTDNQYRRIFYYRMHPDFTDPNHFDQIAQMTYYLSIFELLLMEDTCSRIHLVIDMHGWKLGHITKFNLMTFRKSIVIFEKIFSANLSSIYLVNFPSFMEAVINNMIKPLLKPKLQKKFKICTTTDILLQDFGEEILPKDIGGRLKSFEELNDELVKHLETYRERFEKLVTLRVDESLRPNKLKNDDILGYYGTFRTLNLD